MQQHEYFTHEQTQAALLELLLRFDAFCKEHALRYSLDFGTLLGAVRHKGFIPWDDDIDLSMPRPDVERLLALESELPADMRIRHLGNSLTQVAFPKVITTDICAREHVGEIEIKEYLWLDIFPLDGVSSVGGGALQREWKKAHSLTTHLNWCLLPDTGAWWKQCIKRTVAYANRKHDVRAETAATLAGMLTTERYEASERVAHLLCHQKDAWSLDRAAYEETVLMEFEGHMLPVMSCWHEQLTAAYGDYMQLPPESERQTHGLYVWRAD